MSWMSGPRRVLYVENGIGYGGAAICLRHLVRNLDRTRYEAMVVTGRTGPQYEEISSEARWRYIPDRRVDTVSLGARVDGLPPTRGGRLVRSVLNQVVARLDDVGNFLPFFAQFTATIRRFRPHLIHTNNEPLCNRAAVLAGNLARVPVVAHVRGNLDGASRLMRWIYQKPDHYIPVSNWVSERVGHLGVPGRKRTVIYDGIALEALDLEADGAEFRRAHGVPDEAFAVGLVGLLIPWKGQSLFLDTARELKERIPGLKMLMVGGTPDECADYERSLRQRVVQEGLSNTVVFTGHVNDMPAVYNGLDVVLSASTSPEPLGTMVIECMAMGRPLVAPNHGGGAEMNEHERTALLFAPGDAGSLAESILRLRGDARLAERIGLQAREKALATFSVQQHVWNVQGLYDRILAPK